MTFKTSVATLNIADIKNQNIKLLKDESERLYKVILKAVVIIHTVHP
jgi:hypothetical protein